MRLAIAAVEESLPTEITSNESYAILHVLAAVMSLHTAEYGCFCKLRFSQYIIIVALWPLSINRCNGVVPRSDGVSLTLLVADATDCNYDENAR